MWSLSFIIHILPLVNVYCLDIGNYYSKLYMNCICSRIMTIQVATKYSTDVINDLTDTFYARISSTKDILNTLQPMNLNLLKIQMFIKWQFYLFMFKLYLKFNYHPISPAFMQSDTAFKISSFFITYWTICWWLSGFYSCWGFWTCYDVFIVPNPFIKSRYSCEYPRKISTTSCKTSDSYKFIVTYKRSPNISLTTLALLF